MAECRGCGAAITWAKTAAGRAMPLDREPDPDGNVVLVDGPGGRKAASVVGGEELEAKRAQHVPLYRPHFSTCLNADEFRKR